MTGRRSAVLERARRHNRDLRRSLGAEVRTQREDAGLSLSTLATAAGVDKAYLWRIEAGVARPSLLVLDAIGAALGADLVVRMYPQTGPAVRDRHQVRMAEALVRHVHARWQPYVEVPVWKPARGYVDAVFHDLAEPTIVAAEIESTLPRLEQRLRWHAAKSESLPSADFWRHHVERDAPAPTIGRLLVIRSTRATRELAREAAGVLGAAYPARSTDVHAALTTADAPWPGDGILWISIQGDQVSIMAAPPRGVPVGR